MPAFEPKPRERTCIACGKPRICIGSRSIKCDADAARLKQLAERRERGVVLSGPEMWRDV